ncbi:MAG: hypothetical protein HRT68_12650, partial [Flavobacteriaceae bacterium]|nr:hypothetical protein [Flavobacteriaceae bacterium]
MEFGIVLQETKMKFFGILFLILMNMSCSKEFEHGFSCDEMQNKQWGFKIVDSLSLGEEHEFYFNDFAMVKNNNNNNKLYIPSYGSKKILGFDLFSKKPVETVNYDFLKAPIQDFFIDKKEVYLLTDYPYQLLKVTNGKVE